MTISRFEELFVGFLTLALVPIIAWRIARGLRDGRLPLYRSYVTREEGPMRFGVLLALHALSFFLIAAIAADLLFNVGFRDML